MNVAKTKKRGTSSGAQPLLDRSTKKPDETHSLRIAELAYRLYEERARREGHQLEDWTEAERRISAREEAGERVPAAAVVRPRK